MLILSGMLWLSGGTAYLGWSYFQQPLRDVRISGNQLLEPAEVLKISGLQPEYYSQTLTLPGRKPHTEPPYCKKSGCPQRISRQPASGAFRAGSFRAGRKSDPNQYLPDKYWLLNREKLVLKSIPAGVIATRNFVISPDQRTF